MIGGIEPARTLMLAAFEAGKSVVSANKALLAEDGARCTPPPAKAGVDLYYEAAVAGAIPLLRPLRESLAGDQIRRVLGIVNGTTNYILSRMAETGAGFAEALAEATELGYAEADPTADVDGFDAAAKAAILASLAFHTPVTAAEVLPRGHLRGPGDRHRLGRRRWLHRQAAGHLRAGGNGDGESVRRPRAPGDDPADPSAGRRRRRVQRRVRRGRGGRAADVLRPGRGRPPTASAVLGDLVAVARNRLAGAAGQGETGYAEPPVRPMAETPTRYHVSLDVADKPGVLAHGRDDLRRRTGSASPPSVRTAAATPPRS